eukprot:5736346-Lingulodinium_polyedra.AAC.1
MAQPLTYWALSASEDGASKEGTRAAAVQRVRRGAHCSGASRTGERRPLTLQNATRKRPTRGPSAN